MPSGLYPGIGQQLYRANDNFPLEIKWLSMRTPDPVIPNNKSSVPIAVNAGLNVEINAVYASAPTTNAFEIYYATGLDTIADAYVLDTVAATTDKTYTWTTSDLTQLSGIIWVKNIGTASINLLYVQQKARTTG